MYSVTEQCEFRSCPLRVHEQTTLRQVRGYQWDIVWFVSLNKFNSPLYCEQWNKIKTPWYTPYISSLEAIIYGKHDKTHTINYILVLYYPITPALLVKHPFRKKKEKYIFIEVLFGHEADFSWIICHILAVMSLQVFIG